MLEAQLLLGLVGSVLNSLVGLFAGLGSSLIHLLAGFLLAPHPAVLQNCRGIIARSNPFVLHFRHAAIVRLVWLLG